MATLRLDSDFTPQNEAAPPPYEQRQSQASSTTTLEVLRADAFDVKDRLDLALRTEHGLSDAAATLSSLVYHHAGPRTVAASSLIRAVSFVPCQARARLEEAQQQDAEWAVDLQIAQTGETSHSIFKRASKTFEVHRVSDAVLSSGAASASNGDTKADSNVQRESAATSAVEVKWQTGLLHDRVVFAGCDQREWIWKGTLHSSFSLKSKKEDGTKMTYAHLHLTLNDNPRLQILAACPDPLLAVATSFCIIKARRDLFDKRFTSQEALDRMARDMQPDAVESWLFRRKDQGHAAAASRLDAHGDAGPQVTRSDTAATLVPVSGA